MKKVSILLLFVLCILSYGIHLSYANITVGWGPYSDANANVFRFYRSTSSLQCNGEMWEIPITAETSYTITGEHSVENGFRFMSMNAVDTDPAEEDVSDFSNEVIMKYCDFVRCYADFQVTPVNDADVFITMEIPPSISSLQLRYSKQGEAEETTVEVTGPGYLYDLEAGIYDFELFARDAQGRLMLDYSQNQDNNIYQVVSGVEIAGGEPPPPEFRWDSQSYDGDIHTLMIGFPQNPDMAIDHFRVNLYSSSALRADSIDLETGKTGIETADLLFDEVVARNANLCTDISTLSNHMVFIKVESVSSAGVVSEPVFAERLFGNITDTVIGGTPFESTVIDRSDYLAAYNYGYKYYYFNPYTPTSYDYCSDPDLFQKLPLPIHEASDYNLDYYIKTDDMMYIYRTLFGRTGAGK